MEGPDNAGPGGGVTEPRPEDRDVTQDPAAPETAPPPRRRGRVWWWVLAVLGALLLILALLPTLLGGALLARFGTPAGVSADRVTGPLWAPNLSGVRVNIPGLKGEAGRVGVTVAGVNPLTRVVRLDGRAGRPGRAAHPPDRGRHGLQRPGWALHGHAGAGRGAGGARRDP
ncbi:hypothetical protein DEGR_19570 [Deinococcus grandis]|nr:hypothetical protein DEGR_19570 [Deinococcus grandis]